MAKRSNENLRIKRKYLVWLKDARGLSEASIDKAAASISTYEQFLDGKDFRGFHTERARAFKRHLSKAKTQGPGNPLSPGTINGILRDLMAFLNWLADQPGYKSKIHRSDIAYLSPDRKSETARRTTCWKPHPSPAQVRALLSTMPDGTVLERRDRALVSFLFLTGSRETAAISLSLGHIDLEHGVVQFDGRHVDTKFGKSFSTAFFPIGGSAERIVRDWARELREEPSLLCNRSPLPQDPRRRRPGPALRGSRHRPRALVELVFSRTHFQRGVPHRPVSRPSRRIVFGTPWQSCHASTAAPRGLQGLVAKLGA
jgi:site-specific recombinase XerD